MTRSALIFLMDELVRNENSITCHCERQRGNPAGGMKPCCVTYDEMDCRACGSQ